MSLDACVHDMCLCVSFASLLSSRPCNSSLRLLLPCKALSSSKMWVWPAWLLVANGGPTVDRELILEKNRYFYIKSCFLDLFTRLKFGDRK